MAFQRSKPEFNLGILMVKLSVVVFISSCLVIPRGEVFGLKYIQWGGLFAALLMLLGCALSVVQLVSRRAALSTKKAKLST